MNSVFTSNEMNPIVLGDRALKAVHNSNLRMISFPSYNSEGFGRLNSMINIELRNNFVLPEFIITSLRSRCRFCTLQVYKGERNLELLLEFLERFKSEGGKTLQQKNTVDHILPL